MCYYEEHVAVKLVPWHGFEKTDQQMTDARYTFVSIARVTSLTNVGVDSTFFTGPKFMIMRAAVM